MGAVELAIGIGSLVLLPVIVWDVVIAVRRAADRPVRRREGDQADAGEFVSY